MRVRRGRFCKVNGTHPALSPAMELSAGGGQGQGDEGRIRTDVACSACIPALSGPSFGGSNEPLFTSSLCARLVVGQDRAPFKILTHLFRFSGGRASLRRSEALTDRISICGKRHEFADAETQAQKKPRRFWRDFYLKSCPVWRKGLTTPRRVSIKKASEVIASAFARYALTTKTT